MLSVPYVPNVGHLASRQQCSRHSVRAAAPAAAQQLSPGRARRRLLAVQSRSSNVKVCFPRGSSSMAVLQQTQQCDHWWMLGSTMVLHRTPSSFKRIPASSKQHDTVNITRWQQRCGQTEGLQPAQTFMGILSAELQHTVCTKAMHTAETPPLACRCALPTLVSTHSDDHAVLLLHLTQAPVLCVLTSHLRRPMLQT